MKAEFHNDSENAIFFPNGERKDDAQVPLGTGFDALPDQLIDQPAKKRLSSSTLLILLVIVLAGVGLYSMRSLASAMAGGGADKGLEATIETFLSSISGDRPGAEPGTLSPDDAGEVLLDDRVGRQVPLDDVQKNPFVPLPMEGGELVAAPIDDGTEASARAIAQAREEARMLFDSEATKLRVLMVMGGTEPMANISGRIVRLGDVLVDDRLEVEFTIIEISQGLVVIRGERSDLGFQHDIALRLIRD